MSKEKAARPTMLDRRTLLRSGAAAAFAAPIGVFGAQAFPFRAATPAIDFSEFPICRTASDAPAITGAPRKLKLSWNAGAVCLAPVPVAIEYGFFQKHNLDVELVNYSGSTDQLLEAIATGKTDAGLGMALRWLKPLEQGFDVKIAAGTHGGCMRVLSRANSGVDKLADLKGKIVARRRSRRTGQEFLLDPACQAGHRPQQGSRLARLSRQSAQPRRRERRGPGVPGVRSARASLAEGLPLQGSRLQSRRRIPRQDCCILGLRGSLVRDEPQVAARHDASAARCGDVHRAESGQGRSIVPALCAEGGDAGRSRRRWSRYHTHHHHPVGDVLKQELKALCRRSEGGFGLQAQHRYGQIRGARSMSTYSASDAIASTRLGAAAGARRGSDRRLADKLRHRALPPPWPGSRSACHACGGRISATGRGPTHSALRPSSSPAVALFGDANAPVSSAAAGPALRRRAPWLAGARRCS